MKGKMSERAKTLADAFAAFSETGSLSEAGCVAHIYDDGYVLALAISVEAHNFLDTFLGNLALPIENGRSRDGLSIFIIPADTSELEIPPTGEWINTLLALVREFTDGYNDHRFEDAHTIDLGAALMRRGMEAIEEAS